MTTVNVLILFPEEGEEKEEEEDEEEEVGEEEEKEEGILQWMALPDNERTALRQRQG